nr:CAP domain-containing protein [uncultured Noviherbaspirillum sp.]
MALQHAPAQAQEQERLLHLINAYRQSPDACEGSVPAAAGPLSPEPRLANVDLAQGAEQALRSAGLHIASMEAISLSGVSSAGAAMRVLRGQYCKLLARPDNTLIGISRTGTTWRIVLARPRLPQDPAALAGAGREILDLTNAARAQARTCGAKRYPAAPRLGWNAALAEASRAHSKDMAARNYLAHKARDGSHAGERAQRAGYRWQRIGENIAAGQGSARAAVDGWLSSPGHCANIMNPRFTQMGAAHAVNQDSDLLIYWTQVFGTRR